MNEKSILEMVGGEKHINPHYNIKTEKMDKEEMNEEELFCKLFPEYVVNGKPLSPYFDLFESGYEQSEKRIKELECECRRCVYTDCPCILSDYGKDRNGICDHFKDIFDENAELKLKLDALEGQTPWKDIKDKSEVIGKLTKAKEIIKDLLQVLPEENIEGIYEITEEAERFLKENK